MATRHSMADLIGLKPNLTISAAQIAMESPKPAAPSRNTPTQKAISLIWIH